MSSARTIRLANHRSDPARIRDKHQTRYRTRHTNGHSRPRHSYAGPAAPGRSDAARCSRRCGPRSETNTTASRSTNLARSPSLSTGFLPADAEPCGSSPSGLAQTAQGCFRNYAFPKPKVAGAHSYPALRCAQDYQCRSNPDPDSVWDEVHRVLPQPEFPWSNERQPTRFLERGSEPKPACSSWLEFPAHAPPGLPVHAPQRLPER